MKQTWTAHGTMALADEQAVAGVVEQSPVAARIFVAGEVSVDYIGEAPERLLIGANDAYYNGKPQVEPLFTETRQKTIRMTRFDPSVVWPWIEPELLETLVAEEAKRVGVPVDFNKMETYDFYESVIKAVAPDGDCFPAVTRGASADDFFHGVYLAALILFGKPGYMDVPVASCFARLDAAVFMRTAKYRKLTLAEQSKAMQIKEAYKRVDALTNPEVNFIVGLYEKGTA
jgi:hypothetical protein